MRRRPPCPPTAPAVPIAQLEAEPTLQWHDVTKWGVEGRAWTDMEREGWFDRLPKAANGKVTEKVWSLSRNSAGLMVRFKTDSTAIWANYTLRSEKLGLTNMTPMGASGLDLLGLRSFGSEISEFEFMKILWTRRPKPALGAIGAVSDKMNSL